MPRPSMSYRSTSSPRGLRFGRRRAQLRRPARPPAPLRVAVTALALGSLAAACVGNSPAPTSAGVDTTSPDTAAVDTSTSLPTAGETTIPVPEEGDPCASGEQPFSQDGPMATIGSAGTDAELIADVTWQVHETCEQIVLSFVTAELAPSVDPPEVNPIFLRTSGVLRLALAEAISGSAVVDQLIDTELTDRLYAATTMGGRVIVDLHLAEPAFVRVSPRSRPARMVIDLIPGGPGYPVSAVAGTDTVLVGVTSPDIRYPLTLSGYLNGDGETLEGSLHGADGSEMTVDAALAPEGGLWRGFDLVFPTGPTGRVTIEVGDAPPLELTLP